MGGEVRRSARLSLLILWTVATPAFSAVIVVPGDAEVDDAHLQNCIPLSGCIDRDRYQQLYAASAFGAFNGAEFITELAFRPNPDQPTLMQSFDDVRIFLSTSSADPDALSTTFDDNVGLDETLVYSGALTLSSSVTVSGPGTATDFDILIPLQTPFLYNPALGNLLFEFQNYSGESIQYFVDARESFGDAIGRVYNTGDGPEATIGMTDTLGLVTRFTTVATPEPSTTILLGAAFLAGALFLQRRKR